MVVDARFDRGHVVVMSSRVVRLGAVEKRRGRQRRRSNAGYVGLRRGHALFVLNLRDGG